MEEESAFVDIKRLPACSFDQKVNTLLGIAGGLCFVLTTIWLIARGSFDYAGIRGFTLFDDAMISMRYAYNLATSGVMEWSNSTGRVEGFTNLGWMLIMSISIRLTNIYTAPLAVSVVSALMLLAGIAVLGKSQSKFNSVPLGLRLVALAGSFSLVVWGVRGFETSLLFLLISSIYVLSTSHLFTAKTRFAIFGLVFLGVITRDDFAVFSILYATALVVFKLLARRWVLSPWSVPVTLAFSAVISFLAKAAFRYSYFSDILPNTYYLKVYGHDKIAVFARGLLSLYGNALSAFSPVLLVLLMCYFISRSTWVASFLVEKELDSHLIAASLLGYGAIVGGDAWEWSKLANRFICAALPFILLNFIRYIEIYAKSTKISLPLRREALIDFLPIYLLLLPAFLGFGYLYQSILLRLSHKFTVLSDFSPRSAIQDWLLVGICILILPMVWQSLIKHRQSHRKNGAILLLPCVAILLLSQPLLLIAKAEFQDKGDIISIADDSRTALWSLNSKDLIPSGSKVVSLSAGNFPYYRPDLDFVDPLGKMDSKIAKSKPRWSFYPGHTKWDWDYTLSHYKPDYVRGDLSKLRQEGMWTADKTAEWDHYYQLQEGLIRRKAG